MKRRPMDPAVREQVMARNSGWCERCSVKWATECHHRLFRSRGGDDALLNLAALCLWCHQHAHATNEYPWVVPGRIIRGVYTGPDKDYQAFYQGAAA